MRALIEWLAYALEVGLLFGAAAWVASVACRSIRVPERWVWLSALLLTPLVPVLAYLMPEASLSAGVARVGSVVPVLSLEAPLASSSGPLATAVGGIPWVAVGLYLWFVASVVLSARYISAAGRLRTARAGWPGDTVNGHHVLRSRHIGPAVVGVFEPAIVLPSWVFALDRGIRRLMLKHEREHIAARDPLLLAAARLMIVLTPWNPVTWWMARRLALAIEMDCDARVMRDERDTNLYGVALFEAGRRRSVLAPAFSERVSWLERRMSNILGPNPRRPGKGLLLGASAVAVAGLAMCVEAPKEPVVTEPETAEANAPAPEPVEIPPPPRAGERNPVEELSAPVVDPEVDPSVAPVFVPYESPPQLTNVAEVQRELQRRYPVLLRNAGIGGSALIWFYVNEEGVVANTQLKESSGYPTLDQAALLVADQMRFRPAENRGEAVAVWVAIPIDFSTGGRPSPDDTEEPELVALDGQSSDAGIERVADIPPPARATLAQLADQPVMVEYEMPPTLESEGNARAHLQRYPMAVDESREATIWMLVGTDGLVHDARLKDTSGSSGFDEVALLAAREMRFRPALNQGEPTSVWVAVPIEASRTE